MSAYVIGRLTSECTGVSRCSNREAKLARAQGLSTMLADIYQTYPSATRLASTCFCRCRSSAAVALAVASFVLESVPALNVLPCHEVNRWDVHLDRSLGGRIGVRLRPCSYHLHDLQLLNPVHSQCVALVLLSFC